MDRALEERCGVQVRHGPSSRNHIGFIRLRHVRLDRDSALKIVQHYQIQDPYKHSKLLLSWLDLSMDSLLFVLKEHSRYPIPDSFEDIISLNHMTAHLHLNPNDSLAQGGLEKMIIYGKGLP